MCIRDSYNYGLVGRWTSEPEDIGGEWPINSGHEYIGDVGHMVGTEFFDLNNINSNLLVKELKKIIIIVFDDLNTNNSIPNPKEINLDFIMSKYFKSGRWTNWRLIK